MPESTTDQPSASASATSSATTASDEQQRYYAHFDLKKLKAAAQDRPTDEQAWLSYAEAVRLRGDGQATLAVLARALEALNTSERLWCAYLDQYALYASRTELHELLVEARTHVPSSVVIWTRYVCACVHRSVQLMLCVFLAVVCRLAEVHAVSQDLDAVYTLLCEAISRPNLSKAARLAIVSNLATVTLQCFAFAPLPRLVKLVGTLWRSSKSWAVADVTSHVLRCGAFALSCGDLPASFAHDRSAVFIPPSTRAVCFIWCMRMCVCLSDGLIVSP